MKQAILIHVHKDVGQVKRLVSRLQHPCIDLFINVDAKVDISDFQSKIPNVTYIKNRVEVVWGRFSQVQQILNSFQEIADSEINYSHITFISGQDYPIKPIDEIYNFLKEHPQNSFIDYHLIDKNKNDDWSKVIHKRFEYWHFLPQNDIRNNEFVKKVLQKIGFKRKYPTFEVYYGSCWFSLTLEAVKYILHFINENPSFIKFNQHTGCADELFFQSILLDSPLKDSFINNNYRYIDWSDNGKSPKELTTSDFDMIRDSGAWFARKISPEKDSTIIDLLDNLILKQK